ncbi:flagellar basal body-associated FliL family protein [Dasania marina]|uniref:flagellar basal body-associated FliL family protein n=1 Tax=Dasania marina TaxID=471499 RepID=UPI0030DD1E00|tara:strand:+ start:2552 stop:3109 length:558 start_codon:yes stop_codon:yes gene_type:complete
MRRKNGMAEEESEVAEEATAAKGGKGKIIVLIVAVLVLIAGSVGLTLFFLGFFDPPPPTEEELAAAAAEAGVEAPKGKISAMYFPIQPPFVVNFQSRGRQRFLQTDVTIMTRDPEVFATIQKHLPLIKNRLVMILGGGAYQELQTNEGKELMRQQAMQGVQAVITEETGKEDGVEQVLFTNFVMQ